MNNRECAITLLMVSAVLGGALLLEPACAVQESEIDYLAVPEVSNKERATQRDAFYEGYEEAQEDYFTGKEVGYQVGWCDALSAVNAATGSQLRTEECEEQGDEGNVRY